MSKTKQRDVYKRQSRGRTPSLDFRSRPGAVINPALTIATGLIHTSVDAARRSSHLSIVTHRIEVTFSHTEHGTRRTYVDNTV